MSKPTLTAYPPKKQFEFWQICPICSGTGIESGYLDQQCGWIKIPVVCSVCKGHKIISQFTGKPPKDGK